VREEIMDKGWKGTRKEVYVELIWAYLQPEFGRCSGQIEASTVCLESWYCSKHVRDWRIGLSSYVAGTIV
jgi:hypothetical protein